MGIRIGAEWARDGSDRQVITVQSIRSTPSAFVVGDIIVAINGVPIERRYDVRRLLNRHAIGTNLVVDIMRNNSPHTLSVHVTLRAP
jgi:S1-C subfamily serine protease